MKKLVGAVVLLVAALGLSDESAAGVVFDNGVAVGATDHGGYSCAECPGSFETAENFTLTAGSAVVRDVHWWGMYFNESAGQADSFEVRIYADNPLNQGLPTAVGSEIYVAAVGSGARILTGEVVATGGGLGSSIMAGLPIFGYSAVLPTPFDATAGTTYWLSIVNTSARGWVWALQDDLNGYIAQSTSGTTVFDSVYPARAAFQLTDDAAIPEPGTLTMLALGLAGLAASRRRNP